MFIQCPYWCCIYPIMKTSPTATRHRLDAILHVALELFAQQSYLDRKSLALYTK